MGYSIRSGQWRYTEWIDRRTGSVAGRELYDHTKGPVADRNLADDPALAETVKQLSALLDSGQGWRGVRENLRR
jgi:iduronate 2-sulfatase